MIRSLSTAATGMQAQEQKLEQIANDLANMNTTAFKRGRTEFQDLMYQTVKESGGVGQNVNPVGIQVGTGTRVAAQFSVHEQGPTKVTNGMFDLIINGEGFLQLQQPNGQIVYTRDGGLKLDGQGNVLSSAGLPLVPNLQIPQGTVNVTISPNGEVRATNSNNQETQLGQITLANFINPGAMMMVGRNMMLPTSASGPAVVGNPGESSLGLLQQGAVEASNVKPTEAMMDMITTQRTYESNARIMSVGDQMWSTTNNIGNR